MRRLPDFENQPDWKRDKDEYDREKEAYRWVKNPVRSTFREYFYWILKLAAVFLVLSFVAFVCQAI